MATPIDWDSVNAEFDEYTKKEEFVNNQIRQERKSVKTVDELVKDAKYVNKIIEKNKLNALNLTPKKNDEE